MKSYLLILLLLLVPSITSEEQQFSAFATIPNPNNYRKLIMAPDMTLAWLYDEGISTADLFTAYNWEVNSNPDFKDFTEGVNTIASYKDKYGGLNVFYGNDKGEIWRKQFFGNTSVNSLYGKIKDVVVKIRKLMISPELETFAVSC
jgi:hypothetical protein